MLNRREFIKRTSVATAGVLSFLSAPKSLLAAKNNKKNLLFIMTDQQRYDALSLAGNTVLETPNLDRFGQQGAYFKNAYTPCAVCGPARSAILTGHTVENNGVNSNSQTYDYSDPNVMTMPSFDQVLNDHGYHCEYYGKWHVVTSHANIYKNPKPKAKNGRSVFGSGGQTHVYRDYLSENATNRSIRDGENKEGLSRFPYIMDPLDKNYGRKVSELEDCSQPDMHGVLQMDKEHSYTAFQAKETIEAIERLKDETFSITCSFHFPHAPMTPTEPYYSMYPAEEMVPPVSLSDDMVNSPYRSANGRQTHTEFADPEKVKYVISNYYGLVKEIDDWVGKILDKLDEHNLTENTLVIFTSDHGEMLGAHGMREKNVFYEESAHIPLLMRFPNVITPNTEVDGYVSLIDLFPSILDYLEVGDYAADGTSVRDLIEGNETDHGKYVVTEWSSSGDRTPNYMIVKDGWKLMIPFTRSSSVMNALYNLNTDPHEMDNILAKDTYLGQYYNIVEDLRGSLLEWLEKNNSSHIDGVKERVLITDTPIDQLLQKFETRSHLHGDTTLPYRLFKPENYDPEKSYPIMLCLHGAGERGDDNEEQIRWNSIATTWMTAENQENNPCFVVAPQCPENKKWNYVDWSKGSWDIESVPEGNEMQAVINLLDNLLDEFSIDKRRQYVTGISMGGFGTFDIITRYPNRFAAAIPMSGAGDPSQIELIKHIPLWIFHNEKDSVVPVDGSREIVQAMNDNSITFINTHETISIFLNNYINKNYDYFYTESEEGNHGPWDEWYSESNLHKWVFMKSRPEDVRTDDKVNLPKEYKLHDAYPNPFNPSTTIGYQMPKPGKVKLVVHDIQGRKIKTLVNDYRPAGKHQARFDAKGLSSGVYFCRIQIGNFVDKKKLLLTK